MDKINKIENRMDYVIERWGSDTKITSQEISFILSTYIHHLYKNKKVKDLAQGYLSKIKGKQRLDSESLVTAIASALIVGGEFSEYWNKLKEKIDRSASIEKSNLIVQFLIVLTPDTLKRINDTEYIKTLLKALERQDTEKKVFSCWIKKILFSENEEITVDQDKIKYLKEYLLWELVNSDEYERQKEELRNKFISEILDYKIYRIDWITFLIYQFLREYKLIIITEKELNKKIRHEIGFKIGKKVWFPLVSYTFFMVIKLYLANTLTTETILQVFLLLVGTLLLLSEEKLPLFEIPIKRDKITFGQIGEFIIVCSFLWATRKIPLVSHIWKLIKMML